MELTEFFDQAQQELLRANQDRRHPFRTLVLATLADFPHLRTVVKRKSLVDLSVLVYTDSRTTKIADLREHPNCSLLFYHPKKKLQVTFYCSAEILEAGELFEKHQAIALVHPNDYATATAPKSELEAPEYLYADETHFALLHFRPQRMEILQLGKPQHLRAVFDGDKNWEGQWVVP
ncbi:MAG: pyridoxine/pyridoxamine 5'-phosphate oxidase [Granulosicoccus sp.]|jgi:pyridoxine/pyridoxamine 5'-phosphate oxidase